MTSFKQKKGKPLVSSTVTDTETPNKKKDAVRSEQILPNVFSPLNKDTFEPFYFQIQRQLEEHIRSGKFTSGSPLPGEAELARIFGVSRMTARQALQELTADGLAYREQGRGTFVRSPKVEKKIAHLLGFTAEMTSLGLHVSTRVISASSVPATPQLSNSLQIEPAAEVFHLNRLRFANKEPIAIEHIWISLARFPGIETYNFANHSLYSVLKEDYGVIVGSANEVIEARSASATEAQLLHIPVRSSLLVVSRTMLDKKGLPIETGRSLYRGDRYRAVLEIPTHP